MKNENPIRSAFETTDAPYLKEAPLLKVGENGTPGDKILVDLVSKDIQALWKSRESYLWLIILTCSLYFFFILVVY